VDKKLDQVRQSIHEATAPRPPAASAPKQASSDAPGAQKARANRKRPAASAKKHRKQ
jgi:hypothetical protein